MPSEMKVNKISPASGTAITLGDSGDTFTIPSGVTLAGAGTSLTALNATQLTSGTIPIARLGNDVIDSQHYAAGSIDLEHMSSQSVDEDNLHISNAGTNGQFLSKQSGNTGGLTWADAGGGKVLQVVASSNNTGSATTSTSEVDSANTVTITPSATSSKVLLYWSHPHMYTEPNDKMTLILYMGGVSQGYLSERIGEQNAGNSGMSGLRLFSPSSTSAVVFKTTFKRYSGGSTVHSNIYNGNQTMVAIELEY